MNYSFLVATDMDYTLLMPGNPVSEQNAQAIKKIRDMGGAFTLSTGRPSFLTSAYINDFGLTEPIITSNGASIFDAITRQEIYSALIPASIVSSLLDVFLKNNTNATGYSPDGIYFLPASSRRDFIYNYNASLKSQDQAPLFEITEHIDEDNLPKFNKFLLIKPDEDSLNFVKSMPGLQVVSSAYDFYDVMIEGASKGDGLLRVADYLGIPRDRTFALGDSENDLPMIKDAQYGIAMANSDKRVLDEASYITSSCEEDGFAKAINEFIIPTVNKILN